MDYIQRSFQLKRLHILPAQWNLKTVNKTSWSKASITLLFYTTKISTWWKLASSLVMISTSYTTLQDAYALPSQRFQSVKKAVGSKVVREYDEVYRRAVPVENSGEWTRAKLTKQLQLGILKGPKPEKFVSTVNRQRSQKGICKDIRRVWSARHNYERIISPHHPVLDPEKPGKVRSVCNDSTKFKEVCLNIKLLAGFGLLRRLIGTVFRFPEGLIILTAEIESVFLQVQDRE